MRGLSAVVIVWVLGLFTVVPLCVWLLLTQGDRDNAALLIVLPLFWLFGYFPTIMPIVTVLRIRRWMRLLDDPQRLLDALRELPDGAGEAECIRLIARENRVPQFVVRWLYRRVAPRLREALERRPREA